MISPDLISVIKLGGSLLSLPDLVPRLSDVLRQLSERRCLVICGGGPTADLVRDWSGQFSLSDEAAHWLAISSMDLNRQMLQHLFEWKSAADRSSAEQFWSEEARPVLLNATDFLRGEQADGRALPQNWNVTSDSIAYWTATQWPATELILLKSIPAPQGLSLQEASDREYVDRYFPRIVPSVARIRWCNLRGSDIQIEPWVSSTSEH